MTRAQDGLYLSYVHARMLGGQAAIGHASRFVGEIGRSNLTLRISRRARARPRLLSVKPGDRVRHSRWHDGTVSAVEGRGRETMVTIDFDGAGRQRLQLCYAPLSLIGEDAVDVLAG
jgi:DNA helicase-2/ATP-dependent DNA helicase PcrA